jgi:hypothetical protein
MVRGPGPRLDEEGEDPAGKARPIATALAGRLPSLESPAPRPVLDSEQHAGARAFGGGAGRTAEMGGPRGPRRGSSVGAQGTWGPRRPLPVHAPSSQVTPPLRFAARVLVPPLLEPSLPPLGRRLSSRPVVFLILPPSREEEMHARRPFERPPSFSDRQPLLHHSLKRSWGTSPRQHNQLRVSLLRPDPGAGSPAWPMTAPTLSPPTPKGPSLAWRVDSMHDRLVERDGGARARYTKGSSQASSKLSNLAPGSWPKDAASVLVLLASPPSPRWPSESETF